MGSKRENKIVVKNILKSACKGINWSTGAIGFLRFYGKKIFRNMLVYE